MSSHRRNECDVNRYCVGSGLCVHLDSGMTLLAALPGEGSFTGSGGLLRVAPRAGEQVRMGFASGRVVAQLLLPLPSVRRILSWC